jgi:hypothetical protein
VIDIVCGRSSIGVVCNPIVKEVEANKSIHMSLKESSRAIIIEEVNASNKKYE